MADLRKFRSGVSALKKQELLPTKLPGGKKLDARKALPDWKIKGKKLSTLLKKYDDVVSGKATAVKVPPSKLRSYRKAGFETSQSRVIIPHNLNETAKVTRAGTVSVKNRSGIERVQLPVEFHNLEQYLRDLKKNEKLIDAMKKNNEYFGIRYRGGQRAMFYGSIEFLLDDLKRYEDIMNATSKRQQTEIYQNLEIVRMNRKGTLGIEEKTRTRKRTMTKEANRRRAKRVYERRKGKGIKQIEYQQKRAAYQREYRQDLKKRPKELAIYKAKAIKRRHASSMRRKKRKSKNKRGKRK